MRGRRFPGYVLAIGCVLALLTPAWAAEKAKLPGDAPLVAEPVRQAMQDRDYPKAVKAIDAALAANDAPRDYLLWLKARALALAERHDDALAVLDQFEKEHAKSPWIRQARFSRAIVLGRKGDFRAAELIYRAEAEHLLSVDRKQQIAGIYLEFADVAFKPPKDDVKPDYQKALEFYRKALEVGPKPEKRLEVELAVAQCLQELGKFDEAIPAYEKFTQAHPKSPLELEARFRLGECRLQKNDPKAARRAWQDLLARYPDSRAERMAEAMYHLARTWQLPEAPSDEALMLGVAALDAFVERFPAHKLAARAYLDMAAAYSHRGRHDDAAAVLKRLLANPRYQEREEIPEARWLLGKIYQTQKKFPDALAMWGEYLGKHPTHKEWSSVQAEIVTTEFLMGQERMQSKDYPEARKRWSEFLAKYPLDDRYPGVLLAFGRMEYQQEKWDEAIAQWRRLVSKFPDSPVAAEAQLLVAGTLEEKLNKLEEALEEYRKIKPDSPAASGAMTAIARLTAKSMTVATDRVFRSDETPKLRLVVRNIETLTVRCYSVDLETYFRKMHLARGVEDLDIALISPDKTFEYKVPDYAKYAQLERRVDVPLPAKKTAGVMAVTVTSATLEATTLVVQSDLDVIVKSSRDEVFVLAENMRTGKPWPGVRLLVSNGKQVLAEAVTGVDGVVQKAIRELAQADDVRVFAVAEGNVASNMIDLRGVTVGRGLADKGYVFTDRPAYRAGQIVHVRGCIRHAAADRYTIEADKAFTLALFDSRNRMLHEAKLKLGKWGTLHANFVLPATATPGEYTIQVRDDQKQQYQGSFTVHEYKIEPVRLTVDTPRRVYYRGEEIEGTIRASYYYGAPLAEREIRYQLADDRVHTATTDAKGEVRFKLPTREFLETQNLNLAVVLPELNLQTAAQFLLAAQGFSLEVKSVRPVYVSGETFEVSVTARDAQAKPLATKLVLKVLRQTTVEGRVGQRLVEEHPLATAEDGTARKTLKLAEGGRYVVRAEGVDRFKNTITGQALVQMSDDKDQVRLRILADRYTFKAGETAQVQLHWREAPALALVSFQGVRVMEYRLLPLANGANTLSIPMTTALAPNFELAVDVMTDPRHSKPAKPDDPPFLRLHSATSPFVVERDLKVSVEWKTDAKKTPPRPGQPVDVLVTTADPTGKPVSAEVSLAMVEQALLDRFGWPNAPIDAFFRGEMRQPSVRTTSSVTFSYQPTTRPIDPNLLAEQDRLALAEEEKLSRKEAAADIMLRVPVQSLATSAGRPSPAAKAPRAADPLAPLETTELNTDTLSLEKTDRRPVVMGYGGTKASAPWDRKGATVPGYALRLEPAPKGFQRDKDHDSDGVQDSVWFLLADGQMANVNLGALGGDARASLEKLAKAGARPLPEFMAQETGYWNPSVETGSDGKATLKLVVPERSTAWRLLAKGITLETQAGEASGELVARKDLFGDLRLPMALVDGDKGQILASVHNDAIEKGTIEVTLTTTIGQRTTTEKKTLAVKAKGIEEIPFAVEVQRPDAADMTAHFELRITAGQQSDVARRRVPVLAYGVPVFATAGGSATSDTTAWVEAPKEMSFAKPSLQIVVGPSVERSLLDVVLAPVPWCQHEFHRSASPVETVTSDLMASVGLQELLAGTRDAGGPDAVALESRIRGAVGQLVATQRDDGGWNWTGQGAASDRISSARAVWALSVARAGAHRVPEAMFQKALDYLRQQVAAAANTDYHVKAVLLYALSAAGQGDFALANRLHRDRAFLSPAALAYTALSLAEMNRAPMAVELLALLEKQNLDATAKPGSSDHPTEVRALYALALQKAAPTSAKRKELVEWLLAHRAGHRWSPDRATGPAMLVLTDWFTQGRFQGERYRLALFVNDKQARVLDVDPAGGTQVIDVPAALLKQGKQRVNFQITGRGRYAYQCILSGFVPADKLKTTEPTWRVTRTYEPAPRELDGREIPRGFDVLTGNYTTFRNPLSQLPLGARTQVTLELVRHEERADYVIVTEPLPAGTSVIEKSIRGPFERYEIGMGVITFYVNGRNRSQTIQYDLSGYLPGQYRTPPTLMRDAQLPDRLAVAAPASLTVLAKGIASADPYRLTPQELFELGKRLFAKSDMKAAQPHLAELLEKWNVRPEVFKEAVTMLLDIHLEIGPSAKIVRYFEIIKERWPAEEITFDKIVKVGAAYHEMGEYERSYLVFRATVEGSFARESGVAGFLESQKEFLRSVEVMGGLLREYPPEGYIAAAHYALAQRVYAKAPEAADDVKLRQQKINRVDLVRRAWSMLEGFLTAYPDDPAADQGAFATANALLELKAFDQTAAACDRYSVRYPNSDLVDSYWYIIGYCHFASGRHEKALEMCRKVAETKRRNKQTGAETESSNKWRAIYILGQVYHSLGQAAQAIQEYRRIEDRFADAKEAIAYFLRKAIELPEVTAIKPGEPAGVELKFRNIAACDVKVYSIDLMKFSLLKRNLGGITRVNLSGIRPHFETTIPLGDGKDYRDRTHKLSLPLKEEGAYLVVCRGDDLHASGLVLVTPLAVEVQEDAASGRVRTTVKDLAAGKYLGDVHVKVIGSRNGQFVSGETDLRGVFVADGIQGTSTVIAQLRPSRYAFFRGQTELALAPSPVKADYSRADDERSIKRRAAASAPAASMPREQQLLEGLDVQNRAIQGKQVEQLRQLYERKQQGVEVQKAY